MIHRRRVLGLLAAASLIPSRAFANVAPMHEAINEGLLKHFKEEKAEGTFVFYRPEGYSLTASDRTRSAEAKLPASTFKIPNSIIALETGVVADPDKDIFKWDGVKRSIPAWNQDHTLRSAIAASAVPVYQEIARKIGPERMQRYLKLLEYGNADIGGGIDQFWLTGALRITPVQQIDFLDRLRRGALAVSPRAQELTRDILTTLKTETALVRYKTGLLGAEIGKPSLGWVVGWAEKGNDVTVFAMNMDCTVPTHIPARLSITQKLLTDIGAI